MRIVLVGSAADRVRLRAQLASATLEIVAEATSLEAADALHVEVDAWIVARHSQSGLRSPMAVEEIDAASFETNLTPREIEVLELLALGLSNKVIATRLDISDQTVKFHVSSICGKLGALNRTDAVRRGVRRGLITL
jgi:NarL family two-component system response regulator YdfI